MTSARETRFCSFPDIFRFLIFSAFEQGHGAGFGHRHLSYLVSVREAQSGNIGNTGRASLNQPSSTKTDAFLVRLSC
jgi:hypothetical protein